jgi:hypothetical protein
VVQAAIPDSHGYVHGCYQVNNGPAPKGTLRLIDPSTGDACRFYEKPANWNSNGVAGVYAVAGQVQDEIPGTDGPIPADSPNWQFVATTATVTITNTQSLLANITAGLGEINCFQIPVGVKHAQCPEAGAKPNVEPSFREFGYGVCFQNTAGEESPIVNMNQFTGGNNSNYNAASYEFGEQDYTGIGVAAPGAGTYNVGYCVQNYGDSELGDNNWANGYVEVVDAEHGRRLTGHLTPGRLSSGRPQHAVRGAGFVRLLASSGTFTQRGRRCCRKPASTPPQARRCRRR